MVSWSATLDVFIWSGPEAFLNQHIFKIVPINQINNKFLYFLLKNSIYELIQTEHLHGTTMKHINRKPFLNHKIILPSLDEQERIADKIEQVFSNIEEGESLLKKVQKQLNIYRQSVLKAAVTGELTKDWREANKHRLEAGDVLLKRILKARREQWNGRGQYKEPEAPDTPNLPELPDGWAWYSLDQLLVTIEAGKNLRCIETPPEKDETGIIKISAVTWGKFQENESKTLNINESVNKKWLIQKGDFLFSRANTLELVGASVIVENINKKLFLSDKVLRFVFAFDVSKWVNFFLKSFHGRKQIEQFATGNQLSMRNISQGNIKKICVPLCSVDEIERIVESLTTLFSEIESLEQWCASELTRSATLRQSILKDAFSGKLVPQDPNDEPASELLQRIQAERSVDNKSPKKKPPSTTPTRRGRPRKNKLS